MPTEPQSSSSVSTEFILSLSEVGDGKPMPLALEGFPQKDSEGRPIHYRRFPVALPGDWTHRGTGEPLPLPKERINKWVQNTTALIAAGVKPWATPKHLFDKEGNFLSPDARDTLGYVERVGANENGMFADVALIGDDSLSVAAKNGRSVGISARDMRDAKGNVYQGEALHHLAFCPNPALPGLGGATRIAASADSPAIAVYTLAAANPTRSPEMKAELATQFRAKLGVAANVPDDQLADLAAEKSIELTDKTIALSGDVTKLTGERDMAKAEAKNKADEVLALSADAPKNPDAITLAMYSENISAKREAAINGGLSEAAAKKIDAIVRDSSGNPTALALSACGEAKKPMAFVLYDALAEIFKSDEGNIRSGHMNRDKEIHQVALAAMNGTEKDLAAEGTAEGERYQKAQLAARGLK